MSETIDSTVVDEPADAMPEVAETQRAMAPVHSAALATGGVFGSIGAFENAQRIARALSSSSLVPEQYRGPGNIANCMIALEMSQRIGANPLQVMQHLHVIHGKPSWSSAFLVAAINASGRFEPLRYRLEGEGDKRTCVAWTRDKRTGDEVDGPPVSFEMAKAEGWTTKSGSKWKTMPELMIRYRAAAFFARTVCPELTMGMQTAEEVEDVGEDKRQRDRDLTARIVGRE